MSTRLRTCILLTWLSFVGSLSLLSHVAAGANLGWHLNQLGWRIFGPPEDVYSFTNLFLHRLVAFALVSAPATLVGLFVYERLRRGPVQFSLRGVFVVVILMAVLCAFMIGDPQREGLGRVKAVLFVVLLLAISWYLYRAILRMEVQSPPPDAKRSG